MLNPSDVYVSGGSDNLLVCWTDKVTKYDASSFYNWEQDNLPLHDLDERTHLLWEKFGHPTSALTGMSFIVSANATSSCSPIVFQTLSACVDALPEVINCPILIEVMSFGNLGKLNLSNKAFGPRGALEIINRNSAFSFPMGTNITIDQSNFYEIDSEASAYTLASAIDWGGLPGVAIGGVAPNQLLPCPAHDHIQAKSFTFYPNTANPYTCAQPAPGGGASSNIAYAEFENPYVFAKRAWDPLNNRLTAALSSALDPWDKSASSYMGATKLTFESFDKFNSDPLYDASTINLLTGETEEWGDELDRDLGGSYRGVASFSYFNSLESIVVNDCNGPLYIRNFNVDGQHSVDRGIEIKNSTVNLERTSVSRCNKAGLYVDNSEVNILRGIVAYRNYENTDNARDGIPFAEKIDAYRTQESYGAGIYAKNSTVNFKSTYQRDIEKSIEASAASYSVYTVSLAAGLVPPALNGFDPNADNFASGVIANPSREAMTCFSRNDIGIHAVNSHIIGGRTELDGSSIAGLFPRFMDATDLETELNTEAGIRLENSVLDYSGRVLVEGNYFGVDSVNSKVNIDALSARHNQSKGIRLTNSVFNYNKNLYASILHSTTSHVDTNNTEAIRSQVAFNLNGQDLLCDNSDFKPTFTSSMPEIYCMVYASGAFGKEDNSEKLLPSIQLKGNSNVDLVHAHLERTASGYTDTAQYGLLGRVEDNSTLTLRGSKNYANVAAGPRGRQSNANVAGFYAGNGSTIKIQGPTTMVNLGVDVLAEDHSTIEITPHQNDDGGILASSFDLSNPANHTMVELHSTRACLVADRNSNIVMENVGDYQGKWDGGAYGSSLTFAQDYANSALIDNTSGGYIQFYPNANADLDGVVDAVTLPVGDDRYVFVTGGNLSPYKLIHDTANEISGISTGGMCVRALGESVVKANNVHFPATWPNASSVIYDFDGGAPLDGPVCSRLFIWNIADNSLLEASYLSVSGRHPRDSGYFGPSGTWGLSGAPSSTPDTSSLSVLDYYGQGTDNPYGKSASGENFGAFRLYFSTDPAANFLVASSTNRLEGWARQVFAQGYNFSGNMIASGNDDVDASGEYLTLLMADENGDIHSSGFYYASAMLTSPDTVKAILEDSAMNTFANAKHNTVGKSGLGKVVQGYYAVSGPGGDSYDDYVYGKGIASINNFDLKKDN
jgi:hypothetical protein